MPSKQKQKQLQKKGGGLGAALFKATKANDGDIRACGTQPVRARGAVEVVDRKTAASMPVFTAEDLGMDVGKRAPTNQGMKTVLTKEATMDVDCRIRDAATALGSESSDILRNEECISFESYNLDARHWMPKRPFWDYRESSGRLHHREAKMFQTWRNEIQEAASKRGGYALVFEQNLQVWRQLWRVLERSDVCVLIVDVRHPLFHLPPALYAQVRWTYQKPLVVVLNKLDTVSPDHAIGWAKAIKMGLPGVFDVVGFSQEPVPADSFHPLAFGKEALVNACHRAVEEDRATEKKRRAQERALELRPGCRVSLHDLQNMTELNGQKGVVVEFMQDTERWRVQLQDGQCKDVKGKNIKKEEDTPENEDHDGAEDDDKERILLGFVGQPNVGKSSVINTIYGEKVVSAKATPGHTKILQTLVLDDRTSLCDCPGLVFPRLDAPREVQIIGAMVPIAQVREPFSAVRWLAEHSLSPLPGQLKLKPWTLEEIQESVGPKDSQEILLIDPKDPRFAAAEAGNGELPWSPMSICARYASLRGFVRGLQPDYNLAGIRILERALEGKIPYGVPPPQPERRQEEELDPFEDGYSDGEVSDGSYESPDEEEQAAMKEPSFLGGGLTFEDHLWKPKTFSKTALKKQKKQEALAILAGERDTPKDTDPVGVREPKKADRQLNEDEILLDL